jgi:hypothetical protein
VSSDRIRSGYRRGCQIRTRLLNVQLSGGGNTRLLRSAVFEPYHNLRSPEHPSASTEAFENATLNVGECDLNTAPSSYHKANSEINGVMCCGYDYGELQR